MRRHLIYSLFPVAAGRGACAPGGTVQGADLEGRKYGILNLAASGELAFALQTEIFYTPNTPQTLP